MGTISQMLLRTADADAARRTFQDTESAIRSWSDQLTRFDRTSTIEQLNDAGTGAASGVVLDVLRASLDAFNDTGGLVDVGVGAAVVSAGYDRDFQLLDQPTPAELAEHHAAIRDEAGRPGDKSLPDAAAASIPSFELDDDGSVRIRSGIRLDLGGIAKGWAADRARDLLAGRGSCLVNLGGDLSVHLERDDPPWHVGLELGDGISTYLVAAGGVATSGQDRRIWRSSLPGGVAHHLIDPRTGLPARSDVLRVTVFGSSCLDAEVWAKALFLEGVNAGCSRARALGIPAIITGIDGVSRFLDTAPTT